MEIKPLTLHSKRRIKSRCKISDPKKQEQLVANAIQLGSRLEDLPSGILKDYVTEHVCDSIAYVYKDYIFIFGKNNKRLITVYELPKNLKGIISYDKQ